MLKSESFGVKTCVVSRKSVNCLFVLFLKHDECSKLGEVILGLFYIIQLGFVKQVFFVL